MTPERWKKIEQLCNAALELDESQRDAFLSQACRGDEQLRREVESLLAQEKPAARFLESSDAEEVVKQAARVGGRGAGELVGKNLGAYRIVALVGAGGMGEVYRAQDTRLHRTVAVKVLPAHKAQRSELRERFEREARTIASLNHPRICILYDIGHQDGTDYLVMEYLEGETLAERLQKGPLPLEQVLQYAIEISDALDKAHRKGITHRDLKPGNIMLTKAGSKLLDFGLAKLVQDTASLLPESQLPTMKDGITAQGTILGTLQYMAPEQVEGKTDQIDARTDIFAFGAVMYEMETGKKAFEGKSQASVIAKILEAQPAPMVTLQPMTPAALDHVVKRCLAKDPDERWQSAKDICEQLRWISDSVPQAGARPGLADPTRHSVRKARAWMAVGVVACFLVGIAAWMLKPVTPKSVTRFSISLPPGQYLAAFRPAIAISPDGTKVVYAAGQSFTNTQLYVRALDGLESRVIPGTERASFPFFSPDSQWVGFSQDGKLKKISLSGGPAISLADVDATGHYGASWGSNGMIAYAPQSSGPIQQISDNGGNPQSLTRLEGSESAHRSPEYLPGSKGLLFLVGSTLFGESLATGERRRLLQIGDPLLPRYAPLVGSAYDPSYLGLLRTGTTEVRYVPTGHLVYTLATNLVAAPFDPQRFATTGAPAPVIEDILPMQFSFSNSGSLIYVPGSLLPDRLELVWVDRKGAETPINAPAHHYVLPRISPDGKRVAAGIEEAERQVWVYDLGRDTLTRLTFEGNENVDPVWTPDGKRVVFKRDRTRLFWQPADGSAGAEPLTTSALAGNNNPGSWSPDGQIFAFAEVNPKTGYDLFTLSLKDGKPQPFLQTPSMEATPHFSPDGHFIVYASNESGRVEIYVRPYPGPGGKWQISTQGGTEPAWNPRGGELFYRSGDRMMAVEVTTQGTFSAGKPKMLFEGPYVPSPLSSRDYDVSADGQHFLMLKASGQEKAAGPMQINVVLNWFEELRQKVPTGKQ